MDGWIDGICRFWLPEIHIAPTRSPTSHQKDPGQVKSINQSISHLSVSRRLPPPAFSTSSVTIDRKKTKIHRLSTIDFNFTRDRERGGGELWLYKCYSVELFAVRQYWAWAIKLSNRRPRGNHRRRKREERKRKKRGEMEGRARLTATATNLN